MQLLGNGPLTFPLEMEPEWRFYASETEDKDTERSPSSGNAEGKKNRTAAKKQPAISVWLVAVASREIAASNRQV